MSVEEDALSLLRTFAAKLIQAAVRGFQQRQRFLRQRQGAKCIQRCWRRYSWHKAYINRAASRIQEAWRNRCRRKLYIFYRDLIRFREGSPPVDLLKCINPREASIIDAFSGVHLRFRFGGNSFPPTVLYKIFTHAPVTDICSFCPRNYAAQQDFTRRDEEKASQLLGNRKQRLNSSGFITVPKCVAKHGRLLQSSGRGFGCPKYTEKDPKQSCTMEVCRQLTYLMKSKMLMLNCCSGQVRLTLRAIPGHGAHWPCLQSLRSPVLLKRQQEQTMKPGQ
ncbi:hypothetical protein WJX79_008940 [Trebouxia sp. C0005]